MYRVIAPFVDLEDEMHSYKIGDMYPRSGLKLKKSRIRELAGESNRQRTPLIREEKDPEKE